MTKTSYVLWGSAGHARVLRSLINQIGGHVVATIDNNPSAQAIDDIPLFIGVDGFISWRQKIAFPNTITAMVAIGGGRGRDRLTLQTLFAEAGLVIGTLIHPDATVDVTATIGIGSQVLAQAVIAAEVKIGQNCIINHNASVDHESVLGDGVHIAPGATLCGLVTVSDCAFVGAGAVILPRISIGKNAVVGAGSVVTHDVADNVTVVGNPAREMMRREA